MDRLSLRRLVRELYSVLQFPALVIGLCAVSGLVLSIFAAPWVMASSQAPRTAIATVPRQVTVYNVSNKAGQFVAETSSGCLSFDDTSSMIETGYTYQMVVSLLPKSDGTFEVKSINKGKPGLILPKFGTCT